MKKFYLLVLEIQSAGQTSSLPHIERLEMRDTVFALSLGLDTAHQYLLERSLHTHLEPHPIFATVDPRRQ